MSTLKELMEDIKVKRQTLDEQLKEISGKFFAEQSKMLFEQFPDLKSFSWTQYTPYFNDGDECTFGANTEYPSIKLTDSKDQEDEEFDDEDEDDYISIYNVKKTEDGRYIDKYEIGEKGEVEIPDRKKIVAFEVKEFLTEFEDDSLKAMFGDHVRVTVSRDGTVEQDEYEHD
jgi:hypothetical protein